MFSLTTQRKYPLLHTVFFITSPSFNSHSIMTNLYKRKRCCSYGKETLLRRAR